MRQFTCFAGLLLIALTPAFVRGFWFSDSAPNTTQTELNGHKFTLPVGFEIELAAGPPLVDRPITAAFDDQGRLYVADSSGSNDKVDKQLAEKPHSIVRVEDTDGDGRFDRRVVFADKLMFPEGTMWFDGSLYVSAPPSIWKLTDTDGDGVADQRVEWFAGKTLTGCANDLHGPYLGPDGWIYWAKGAFARQTYERVGKSLRVIPHLPMNIVGKEVPVATEPQSSGTQPSTLDPQRTWSTRASHIFRCRPDGSGLEVVMTGGMDNPVDVVFTPTGERIFTSTFLVHPGGGLRDGLLHAVYGGIYGKDHDPIHEPQHKWTNPDLMPVLAHLGGAAAPCGLEIYRSQVFGADYQNNLFTCCFNMHKITRHVLEPAGATFKSHDSDFLVSSNLDFHPTDILEDADGSLVIVDTGGWYKLCCPTSQLHKPDILGGIYRVRRTGRPISPPSATTDWRDPRGQKIDWARFSPENLTHRFLADARPAVRDRAMHELARRGAAAVPALADAARVPPFAELRRNAVWTLTRIDHADARTAVRAALDDRDESVRQVALHSVSLWRDRDTVPRLIELLRSGFPQIERAAAEALGRIGDRSAVAALFSAVRETVNDRFLDHSLTYALIEIADRDAFEGFLHLSSHSREVRAAMIALDQMDGGGLDPKEITSSMSSSVPNFKDTASWIARRHPEWGGELAGYLHQKLASDNLPEPDRAELTHQLALFAKNPAVQELLATALTDAKIPLDGRVTAARAMQQAGVKELPKSWANSLIDVMNDKTGRTSDLVHQAVLAVRAAPPAKDSVEPLKAAILSIARATDLKPEFRLDALASLPGGVADMETELFGFIRENLAPDTDVRTRSVAADVLARSKLKPDQLASLVDSLQTAGPLEVDRLLTPFGQCSDEAVGLKLVAKLKESPALTALRADSLKTHLAKFGAPVHEQAQQLYAAINVDLAKQKERLDELLASLTGTTIQPADIRRGQAVFMSQKAACASCHQFGYLGGKVGPDLTRIGGVRNERDLLESIAFPSASLVRSYESVVVARQDGRIHSGILRKDASDEVIIATNATEEVRIAREEIEEVRPGSVSVMPSGLDQQLTSQELADLVAFLKAAK